MHIIDKKNGTVGERLHITVTLDLYNAITQLADKEFEGNISRAVRKALNEYFQL